MEILRRQWMRRREELLVCLVALAAGCSIGVLLFWRTESPAAVLRIGIPMGSIMGYGAALLVHLIYGIFSMPGEFNLAVTLGGTRRQFVQGSLLFGLAELVGAQIAAGILQKLEIVIYGVLFAGIPITRSPIAGESLAGYLLLLELGILAAEMLTGALLLRFGPRVLWVVMAVVFVLPSVQQGLIDRGLLPEQTLLTQALIAGDLSIVYTIPRLVGYTAVWLLLLAAAWALLRRQQVTG